MKPGLYIAIRRGLFLDVTEMHKFEAGDTFIVPMEHKTICPSGDRYYVSVLDGDVMRWIHTRAIRLVVVKDKTDPLTDIRFVSKSVVHDTLKWGDLNVADTIKHLGSHAPWKQMYWYHGTCPTTANLICNQGLDPSKTGTGYYGKGVYLASTQAAARCYGDVVLKVKLTTEKLLWVDGDTRVTDLVRYATFPFEEWFVLGGDDPYATAMFVNTKLGYDGLFITDSAERMLIVLVNKGKVRIKSLRAIEKKAELPDKAKDKRKSSTDEIGEIQSTPNYNPFDEKKSTNPFDAFL